MTKIFLFALKPLRHKGGTHFWTFCRFCHFCMSLANYDKVTEKMIDTVIILLYNNIFIIILLQGLRRNKGCSNRSNFKG